MLLKYYKTAIEDIENIFFNIFQDKPEVAKQYVIELKERIEILKDFPMIGKDCKAKGINKNCKIFILDNYIILYKLSKNIISIQRVINQKQNYNKGKK